MGKKDKMSSIAKELKIAIVIISVMVFSFGLFIGMITIIYDPFHLNSESENPNASEIPLGSFSGSIPIRSDLDLRHVVDFIDECQEKNAEWKSYFTSIGNIQSITCELPKDYQDVSDNQSGLKSREQVLQEASQNFVDECIKNGGKLGYENLFCDYNKQHNISNQMEGLETDMLQYGFIFSDWRDMEDVPDTQRNELCGEHELLDSTYLHLPFATKYRCISIGLISTSQSNMNGDDNEK